MASRVPVGKHTNTSDFNGVSLDIFTYMCHTHLYIYEIKFSADSHDGHGGQTSNVGTRMMHQMSNVGVGTDLHTGAHVSSEVK